MSEHSNFTIEDRILLATVSKEMGEVKVELKEIKLDISTSLRDLKDLVIILQSLSNNMNDKVIKHDKDIDDIKENLVELNLAKKIVFGIVGIVGTAVVVALLSFVIINK